MIETVVAVGVTANKIVIYGFLLGLGFWGSKKLTNKLDEVLLAYDKREMKRLEEEMNLCSN